MLDSISRLALPSMLEIRYTSLIHQTIAFGPSLLRALFRRLLDLALVLPTAPDRMPSFQTFSPSLIMPEMSLLQIMDLAASAS
jgi:hypothetical protein